MESKRRCVITGAGVIAPNGLNLKDFWSSLCAPKSAASFIDRFDTKSFPTRVGCTLSGFNAADYMPLKMARRYDPYIQFSVAASVLAVKDSRIDLSQLDPDRIGVVEGTTIGGLNTAYETYEALNKKGYRGISTFDLLNGYTGGGSSEIAINLGITGHATTICTACSSGSDAIGYSLGLIQDDDVDIMITGASEAPILPAYWGGFCASKSMSRETNDPARAMKPFHKDRDGFILGEGAAYVVLEELSHALARNAKIYAEVIGYGRSCDAYHSVAQHPEGKGAYRSLEKALRRARIDPTEVDYINVHGSATATNDIVETRAIKHVFKSHAKHLQISATKPVTGHMAGAAGAVESLICALAIKTNTIPPTMNLTDADPECDLDYVPNQARSYPINVAVNMNAGFGGKNACVILKRYDQP